MAIPPHPPEPLASHSLLPASASHLAPPPPPRSTLPILPLLVNPIVWDTSIPVVATHHPPIRISLMDPNQYPLQTPIPYFGHSSQRHKINNYQTLKSRPPCTYKFPM
jgi:hypothetical protein